MIGVVRLNRSEIKETSAETHIFLLHGLDLFHLLGLNLLDFFLLVLLLFLLAGILAFAGWDSSTAAKLLDAIRDQFVDGLALQGGEHAVQFIIADVSGNGAKDCLDVGGGCITIAVLMSVLPERASRAYAARYFMGWCGIIQYFIIMVRCWA